MMEISSDNTLTVRERLFKEAQKEREKGIPKPNYFPAKFKNLSVRQYRGKRILDLALGFFALIVFIVTYPFIAAGIKLSSKGPVLFRQQRTGRNGITFTCYKYRTMYTVKRKQEEGIPDITVKGDSRVFPFGKFLRLLNLDELPQVLNVLKGEMSLVGPRPYPVEECAYWNSSFDDFFYRYAVKPGITGFAQVKGYRGGTLEASHMRKRTDFDLIYVQKNTFLMDLRIIIRTVTKMINLDTNAH
jgi:putative colanic acid biosysnthesis UDP-glucose lipid carrier transferase